MISRDFGIISLDLRPDKGSNTCPESGSQMDVGSCTDVGRVRGNNEDTFLVAPELNLHVLSDGMGGMASGEIASRLTVETVVSYCRDASTNSSVALVGNPVEGISEASNRLASGIRLANRVVHKTARDNGRQQKMGATVVAVSCTDGCMSVAHVGDSRAYRLRGGHLELLTRDHTFMSELRQRGAGYYDLKTEHLRHLLTRAVGVEPEVDVEVTDELIMESDTVLLCSDGLTRELSDEEIGVVLRGSLNAQEAADELVNLANEAGGKDNITAIVIRYAAKELAAISSMSRLSKWFSGRRN